MRQITLISLYGQKTKNIEELLDRCAGFIQDSVMGDIFIPYKTNQIHGTLIGMEKLVGFTENFNANIWTETGNREVMEFAPLKIVVRKHLPMRIRFGGFEKSFRHFHSFGKNPYERSFQIQWQKNKITLIGWPHENGDFHSKKSLESLREDIAVNCNIRHKYKHDNDFYMVLGEIKGNPSVTASEMREMKFSADDLEENIRDFLANHPAEVEITPEQVFLSQYIDATLPLETTTPHCLANPGIDADFIRKLYS